MRKEQQQRWSVSPPVRLSLAVGRGDGPPCGVNPEPVHHLRILSAEKDTALQRAAGFLLQKAPDTIGAASLTRRLGRQSPHSSRVVVQDGKKERQRRETLTYTSIGPAGSGRAQSTQARGPVWPPATCRRAARAPAATHTSCVQNSGSGSAP